MHRHDRYISTGVRGSRNHKCLKWKVFDLLSVCPMMQNPAWNVQNSVMPSKVRLAWEHQILVYPLTL